MDKKIIVSKILYCLAIIFFIGYLITKESVLMASGGLSMIGGGIAMISANKKK